MKKLSLTFIALIIAGFTGLSAQTDTLNSVSAFDAPSQHPWGLAYDGTNLWVSDSHTAEIFEMNSEGEVLSSITLESDAIMGITFVNDSLWVMNSVPTGDSTINETTYPVYPVYQVNKNNGEILDSLNAVSMAGLESPYTFWGLCEKDDYFYISFNGGYGPAMLRINRFTGADTNLCCSHVKGMTVISDSIWAVSYFDKEIVTTDGADMYVKYRTIFGATDFTYDGTHFWMADTVANKIRKMEAVDIIGYESMVLNNNLSIFPNPAEDYICIESGDVQPEGFLKIFDVNGELIRKVRAVTYQSTQRINVSELPSGVYVITLERENGKYAGRFMKR